MTIYELEKQATPGPWKANGPGVSSKGYGYIVTAREVFMNRARREANAQLLACCRNNFIQALEALKKEHEGYTTLQEYHTGEVHYPEYCDTCKLIKDLETVR